MDQYEQFYHSVSWRKFRQLAYITHGVNCTECLKKKPAEYTFADTIHHITEVRKDWSKRLDLSNVTPVCASCHNKIHEDIKAKHASKQDDKPSYVIKV